MIDFLLGFLWAGEKKGSRAVFARYIFAAVLLGILVAMYSLMKAAG